MIRELRRLALFLTLGVLSLPAFAEPARLVRNGQATQLVVDGKPFLVLGGELGNSASSSAEYMAPIWPRMRDLGLNTLLAPVSWELLEPQEGRFDFAQVDSLIAGARQHDLKLVLLWFGAWKNSMSTYPPAWVKRDQTRFPRAKAADGSSVDILSAFSPNLVEADAKAFAALMGHLKAVDSRDGTVLMVQVENEIGMLPSARDHSVSANAALNGMAPASLAKGKTGSWAQVLGTGPAAEETFTAWHYARFVETLVQQGKRAYDLPMFVNAALNRPGKLPGEYPSGGPLPHLIQVWKAGAPSLDFLAPDIYFSNFTELAAKYALPGNPLFIPEANRADQSDAPANAFWAFGAMRAIGFSPFAIDSIPSDRVDALRKAYRLLAALSPAILDAQARGTIVGGKPPIAFDGSVNDAPQRFQLGGYQHIVTFIDPWTPRDQQRPADHAAMIIHAGDDEFLIAGQGATLTFGTNVGIENAWEQHFADGRWTNGRLLNGDETHQGRHIRLPPGDFTVQRVKLYRYR